MASTSSRWKASHRGDRVQEHITLGRGQPRDALAGYRRFPTWMWGNEEVLELVEWMRGFNDSLTLARPRPGAAPPRRKAGFHGLDVYSLHDSLRLIVKYLEKVDPKSAPVARRAFECFGQFDFGTPVLRTGSPGSESRATNYAYGVRFVPNSCEAAVTEALSHMDRLAAIYRTINPDHADPGEAFFDARMNALVARNAEAYYRTLVGGEAPSWNIRDQHMLETLGLLLDHYGAPGTSALVPRFSEPGVPARRAGLPSRAIVWAHNTHIGDYRATDMKRAGYVNLGGLAREKYGADDVRLIGFGTHHGTVIAANAWGDQGQIMEAPEALPGTLEDLLHELHLPRLWLPLRWQPSALRERLNHTIGHRAIGVVYHPQYERRGQYVPTRLADRYYAFMFIDETQAVRPLEIAVDVREEPEAWPSGL